MKKPVPPAAIVAAGLLVVVLGWFAFSKMTADPVVTGTKTGYGPNNLPPPPTFKIPPPPNGASSVPPPAGMRPPTAG